MKQNILSRLSTPGCWHIAGNRTNCDKCSEVIRPGDSMLVFHRQGKQVCEFCATGRTRPRLFGPRNFDEAPYGYRG